MAEKLETIEVTGSPDCTTLTVGGLITLLQRLPPGLPIFASWEGLAIPFHEESLLLVKDSEWFNGDGAVLDVNKL